ncbi:MAG: methyltransferase domain-containing protein [Planctomycetes bacterium]|nr:methyltransferase domain-containing protein [Planctomycetota bacterium]
MEWFAREVYPRLNQDISTRLRDAALELDLEDYLRVLGDLAGRRVLDFGAGQGHKAIFFASLGAQVLALDAEAPQVERCRDNLRRAAPLAGAVDFRLGDETTLGGLEGGAYDVVFSSEVIEHFPRDRAGWLCGEFLRLLRPGGVLLLTTPNGAVVAPEEQPGEGHYAHHHNFTLEELDALLAGHPAAYRRLRGYREDQRRNRCFYRWARLDTRLRTSRRLSAPMRSAYGAASAPLVRLYNRLVHPWVLARSRRNRALREGDLSGRCIFYAVRKAGP